jgi:hypothetical protein
MFIRPSATPRSTGAHIIANALIMLDRPSDILIFLFDHSIPSSDLNRMNDEDTRPPSPFRGIKLPWGAVILTLMLTAAVWIFFYLENMQLDSGSTAAVAFVFIIVVMLGRSFLMRGQRRRGPNEVLRHREFRVVCSMGDACRGAID